MIVGDRTRGGRVLGVLSRRTRISDSRTCCHMDVTLTFVPSFKRFSSYHPLTRPGAGSLRKESVQRTYWYGNRRIRTMDALLSLAPASKNERLLAALLATLLANAVGSAMNGHRRQ